MNTTSKITLVAAVLTSLAAPAFATAIVPEFPGELAQPTAQTQSYETNASQSYASSRAQWTPARNAAPTRSWSEQRSFDRGSAVIN
jgi:hypothetical protein